MSKKTKTALTDDFIVRLMEGKYPTIIDLLRLYIDVSKILLKRLEKALNDKK
jgi:hypothetical protein